MNDISLLLAFSAGLLSFLSPCVLPMVPAYLSYLTGSAASSEMAGKGRAAVLVQAVGFIIGFSAVFIALGATASALGRLLSANIDIFRKVGGLVVIVMGLHTMGIFRLKFLYREKRLLPFGEASRRVGAVLIGIAFAAGWTPCIGPILSSILIYAGSSATVGKGLLLLTAYSLGLAVPFLAAAFAIDYFQVFFKRISKALPVVSVVSGVLLIIMGLLIFTNHLGMLSQYLGFLQK